MGPLPPCRLQGPLRAAVVQSFRGFGEDGPARMTARARGTTNDASGMPCASTAHDLGIALRDVHGWVRAHGGQAHRPGRE
jgi:hypothetical protein